MQEEPRFHTKRELAVHKMKDAILLGRYRPGQSLRQVQLMADLGLGATPAREAALELVARGLLVHESHRGVRVAELDRERVAHVYEVRALLESEAARLATASATEASVERLARCARAMESAFEANDLARLSLADEDFHRSLCEGAGNPVLLKLIGDLWDQFPRYMLWRNPARVAQSLREHRQIARRFARHDAEGTARAVRDHILHGLAALDAMLREQGHDTRSPA